MPEWWEMYLASYERGKKAKPFVCEDFEHWLAIPYSKIKEDIFGK
jgi:hypothetical protein